MEKLGPGSNVDTLQVLAMIPHDTFPVIVDAGCGAGRQTLALATRLQTKVHAVDISERHLESLARYSAQFGVEDLVQTHRMDMADIPAHFPSIDLLWSECAAYHIGFPNALRTWFPALKPGGYAVVSELSWLRDEVPDDVRAYFRSANPTMRTVDQNLAIAQSEGYEVIATHLLSRAAWIDGYYDKLEPLAQSLLQHPDDAVRKFADETLKGIRIFDSSDANYAYVFYVLTKPNDELATRTASP